MSEIPIIIACRDRLSSLRELISWLEVAGHERIILVDNDSRFEPLLEYYKQTPHSVVQLNKNIGPQEFWTAGVVSAQVKSGRYVITDPDVVPDPDCPRDAIWWFNELLDRHPERVKAGFGLRIDDLPDHFCHAAAVRQWEAQFWEAQLEPDVYSATIDTTFALYRAEVGSFLASPAIRTGGKYLASHRPWYEDLSNPSYEHQYYHERYLADRNRDRGIKTSWNDQRLPHRLKVALGQAPLRSTRPWSRAKRYLERGFKQDHSGY